MTDSAKTTRVMLPMPDNHRGLFPMLDAYVVTRAELPEFDPSRVFVGCDLGSHRATAVMCQSDVDGRVWVIGELQDVRED